MTLARLSASWRGLAAPPAFAAQQEAADGFFQGFDALAHG